MALSILDGSRAIQVYSQLLLILNSKENIVMGYGYMRRYIAIAARYGDVALAGKNGDAASMTL